MWLRVEMKVQCTLGARKILCYVHTAGRSLSRSDKMRVSIFHPVWTLLHFVDFHSAGGVKRPSLGDKILIYEPRVVPIRCTQHNIAISLSSNLGTFCSIFSFYSYLYGVQEELQCLVSLLLLPTRRRSCLDLVLLSFTSDIQFRYLTRRPLRHFDHLVENIL